MRVIATKFGGVHLATSLYCLPVVPRKQCSKAGIPMIDTIHVEKGFNAREVLKKIVAKGWDKFFVKPGYMSFFGAGVINGSLARTRQMDCLWLHCA